MFSPPTTAILLAFVTSSLPAVADAASILLMPFPYASHIGQMSTIGGELRAAGHDVHMILSSSYPDVDRVRKDTGFNVVEHAVADPDFYTDVDASLDWIDVSLRVGPIEDMRMNVDGFVQMCTNAIEDPTLPGRLRDLHVDLAVVDAMPYSRCYWILLHRIGIPYVGLTTCLEPWLFRVPAVPSFVPFPYAGEGRHTERMTFGERLRNVVDLVDWSAWPRLAMAEDAFVQRYLPGETYSTLAARTLLWLIDTDVVVDYPRPTMPNEVNIGGLSTTPARPLTGEFQEFANRSDQGLIVASFGSQDFITARFFDQFYDAFSSIKDVNILWRVDGEIPASHSSKDRWPDNIRVVKWLPQNDILGHPNTKLFVSHCGSNSQFEAIYHGVPTVCVAIYADQMYNAARMQYRGYGLDLGRMYSITSDKLVSGIRDVLNNQSYTDNVRAASAIFRSRMQTPRQRARWWIEHVLRHGGRHLRSYGLDMPWYEYLMVDVLALCVLLPVVVVTSSFTAFLCWCCQRHRRQTAGRHLKKN